MKTMTLRTIASGMALIWSLPMMADVLENTSVDMSGYIKADALYSTYSDGTLASGNIGRDFYVPGLTPVGGIEEDGQFDAHIRQTRFRFTSNTDLGSDEQITGVLEFDLIVTPGGNERISNSYEPRVRHAFIKYQNWLIGQTWSTFQDVKALPESADFIGATDGTIFDRQAMVRYTHGAWEFALENPETTVTPFGGGGRIVADDNAMPDFVTRYTHKGDWGHLSVAGLLRQLSYVSGNDIDSSETSYGLSVTTKINLGRNDLRVMANMGAGMGRYIGLNTANGAVLNAEGELEAIDSIGYSVAYRHWWSEQWRSNFIYSSFSADNETALTGLSVTKQTFSARVNLMYSPNAAITLGVEYAHANRELESGTDGDMDRLQFSAKYAF